MEERCAQRERERERETDRDPTSAAASFSASALSMKANMSLRPLAIRASLLSGPRALPPLAGGVTPASRSSSSVAVYLECMYVCERMYSCINLCM